MIPVQHSCLPHVSHAALSIPWLLAWSEANSEEGVQGKSQSFALPGLLEAAPHEAHLAAALARVSDEGRPTAALAVASCLRHAHGAAAMAALFRLLRLALAQQV